MTGVAHFFTMENKLGVETAPELLELVCYSRSLHSCQEGGALDDGKVPMPLQVTWAVCREHLCPGDGVGASDPSSLLPVGT